MQRLFMLLSVVATLFFVGCMGTGEQRENRRIVEEFFAGSHPIHRMMPTTAEAGGHLSGFFLFGSGYISGSDNGNEPTVTFAWRQREDRPLIFSTLPLKKIRVEFRDSLRTPQVEFQLVDMTEMHFITAHHYRIAVEGKSTSGPEYVLDGTLAYAVITVRPEDWPAKIQMPL